MGAGRGRVRGKRRGWEIEHRRETKAKMDIQPLPADRRSRAKQPHDTRQMHRRNPTRARPSSQPSVFLPTKLELRPTAHAGQRRRRRGKAASAGQGTGGGGRRRRILRRMTLGAVSTSPFCLSPFLAAVVQKSRAPLGPRLPYPPLTSPQLLPLLRFPPQFYALFSAPSNSSTLPVEVSAFFQNFLLHII